MNSTSSDRSATSALGGRPSIIERFGIEGLYGYRSVSLSSAHAATILIARNGAGKTTLLGALDAFLRLQFSRLRELQFSTIYCKLDGEKEDLVLRHDDISDFLEIPTDVDFVTTLRRIDADAQQLFRFLTEDWPTYGGDITLAIDHPIFNKIIQSSDYRRSEVVALCSKLSESLLDRNPRIATIRRALKARLSGFDIVYLPTYRRVEMALREEPQEARHRRRRPRLSITSGSLLSGDIQFGLSDIADRLSELNQRIVSDSNVGYREISANIINELIDGSFEREADLGRDIPTKEELTLFFSRLSQGTISPFYSMPVPIPNIDKIYSHEGVSRESTKFLNYFLSKLSTVISATHDIERSVEDFINACNKYLSSSDDETTKPAAERSSASEVGEDDKVLVLNKRDLKVHVESLRTGRKISLDALSSGEKQMVSLFAKLFLYKGEKIVLIDEPELSLSIDWQRQILVDVISAPLCRQIVAITHSPFVFENDLEPFAKSIKLSVDLDALSAMSEVEDDSVV